MLVSTISSLQKIKYPPFDLTRLLQTVFKPNKGEKLCILIDLDEPKKVKDFAFLKNKNLSIQKKAYEVFYQGLLNGVMQKLQLGACDFFAYQKTGGSNLELPSEAMAPDGSSISFESIYSKYDIILCISTYSATAPLTAASKKYGFRGSTMHGINDIILKSGLAVDYNEVSRETELLRKGMTQADYVEIDFEVKHKTYHLHIDLNHQEAQKSHGLCYTGGDIANLPAGEIYFVPYDASGNFPIKFEQDGTIGLMSVDKCRVNKVTLIEGDQGIIDQRQFLLDTDPATGILGELGFGTQILPFSGSDIQDEKIFGTFHLATGRNDHLNGSITKDRFINLKNASHDDILFSPSKTPEIHVKQVSMKRFGKKEILIENYEASEYLWNLRKEAK